MENNKETRMISSDEIFYAVLKDGTIVNNVKSLLTFDKQDILQSLFVKVLNANVDILLSSKNYTNSEKAPLMLSFFIALKLSRASKENLIAEMKSEFQEAANKQADMAQQGGNHEV